MPDESEELKIRIVGPVETNTDNPWRTQGDYREDQAQMLKAYRWAVAASLAAIITALCSIVLAVTAIAEIKEVSERISEPQKVVSHEC